MEIKSLADTLAYKNDHIIYKFLEKHDVSFEEAEDIFTETKRWLWYRGKLIHDAKSNNKILKQSFIDIPLLIIDEMWHTFILFTKDYRLFCQNYLYTFIDHNPTTKTEKDEMQKFWKHLANIKTPTIFQQPVLTHSNQKGKKYV